MNEGRVKKYSHLWGCNSVTTICVLWLWITLFVTCYLMSCLLWRCDVALSEWESVWVVTGGCYDCYDMTHWFTPPKSTLPMITYMSVKQSLLMLSRASLITTLSGSLCLSPITNVTRICFPTWNPGQTALRSPRQLPGHPWLPVQSSHSRQSGRRNSPATRDMERFPGVIIT